MTLTRKSLLLASAAVVVMGFGMTKPAMAFDEVNWTWDSTVTDEIANDILVSVDIQPPGYAQLEKLQAHIGDVTATSTVTGFVNNPPGEEEDPSGAPIPQTVALDLKAIYDDNETGNPITDLILRNGEEIGYSVSNWEGHVDNNREKIYLTFDLTEEIDPNPAPIPVGERDAIDLPLVNSVATAVGNNQALEGGVALALHDAQFLFGGFEGGEEGALEDLLGNLPESDNTHTSAALALTLAGAMGLITPSTVTADSSVTGTLNAMVDSQATAIANNMSVELASFVEGETYFMGDVTQFAYADVSATSTVDDLTIEGYSGMGDVGLGPIGLDDVAQVPVLNSVATAIGNNFSLRIGGVDVPDVE